ncbi:DUF6000 family protein [Amycolatopsis regifaucium]|uniref:Uncharacterized protein n=1 Tax=Amycolatopsis regifaucium TaxID=546365 RepID=A0A154MIM7_9PSEU|nr:DUF6000 family protein [Amycolatopsis regifaucium]KZB84241.1 hypothetical protein AVL48_33740 [Amycolatopsis regifaucium]OKA03665.1 hypothetical protein ATP06_0234880 [Amycolatopsis regifaucium]SFJ22494.1 hypothetical protein SAMN04489731_11783 [Amycolatopsis regifaucium]
MPDAIDRYARERYSKLLHGNFASMMSAPEREVFLRELAEDARRVTDDELEALFEADWRPRLTAAWLVGVDRRAAWRDRIREPFLASDFVFAGQGYCFALARFGTFADAELLVSYLDHYLARPELRYDQEWALAALHHIDADLRTAYTSRYLRPGGLWESWSAANSTDLPFHKMWFDLLCSHVQRAVHAADVRR